MIHRLTNFPHNDDAYKGKKYTIQMLKNMFFKVEIFFPAVNSKTNNKFGCLEYVGPTSTEFKKALYFLPHNQLN